jgi:hypothetical protein
MTRSASALSHLRKLYCFCTAHLLALYFMLLLLLCLLSTLRQRP